MEACSYLKPGKGGLQRVHPVVGGVAVGHVNVDVHGVVAGAVVAELPALPQVLQGVHWSSLACWISVLGQVLGKSSQNSIANRFGRVSPTGQIFDIAHPNVGRDCLKNQLNLMWSLITFTMLGLADRSEPLP